MGGKKNCRGRTFFTTALIIVLALCGCQPSHSTPTTQPAPLRIKRLVLLDIQGLWGGHSLYIGANGKGWQQTVLEGQQEDRFECVIRKDQLELFAAVLADANFFEMKSSIRPGVPDEASPELFVELEDGRTHQVRKWQGDAKADKKFHELYQVVFQWCQTNAAGRVGKETWANFDWDWRPQGFKDIRCLPLTLPSSTASRE